MRKLTCLLLCLSSPFAFAQADAPFSGYFINGNLGGAQMQANVDQFIFANISGLPNPELPSDLALSNTAVSGSLGLTLWHQFSNNLVMGWGLTAGYSFLEIENNASLMVTPNAVIPLNSELEIKLSNDFSILFKPGYVVGENTLFYALVGGRWGYFDSSTDADFSVTLSDVTAAASGSDETRGYELGITAGFGIQQVVSDHFSLGLEYVYTSYGSIDTPHVSVPVMSRGSIGTFIDAPDIDVSTNSIMLTLSYRC